MESSPDPDSLLYAAGGILGIFAVAVFSLDSSLALSPVTKSLLLAMGFMFFLPLGFRLRGVQEKIMYGLALTSFLGLVYYVNTFFQGIEFVLLALASLVLSGTGYLARKEVLSVGRKELKLYLGAILLLALAATVFDVSSPQLEESLVLDNSTITETGRVGLGSVVVTNDFMLPREYDAPGYSACVYGPNGEMLSTPVMMEERETINGRKLTQLDLWVHVPAKYQNPGGMTVRSADSCGPGYTDTIIVVDRD